MALAYSYIRFSTPDQLKGDSLRRQLDLSERYVNANNLTLDTSLTLHDLGLSAFHGKNIEKGALGAFLAAIDQGKVKSGSFLLVESLDRLSRAQVIDALELFTSILNKGITIVTLSDGQVYSREAIKENWTGLIISIAVMARAHEESATKSKRLLAAWAKKISDAREGGKKVSRTCPSWLVLSGDRSSFSKIPEKVAIVQRIFKMVREGLGTYTIERTLNQENVSAIGFSDHWHKSYLLNILSNRAVIGEYQYCSGKGKNRKPVGDPIPNYYPPIITEEEFYSVQKIMSAKRTNSAGRKGAKVPNLLSGLCKCGYCGGAMTYVDKGDYDTQRYLVCSNAKRGIGCKHTPWIYSEIERLVLNFLTDLQVEDISDGDEFSLAQELEAIQGKLEQLIKAQQNIVLAIEAAPKVSVLLPRLLAIEQEISEVRQRKQELEVLCSSGDTAEQRVQDLKQLRDQLAALSGDELYRLRMRVLSELKQLLDSAQFFPLGIDPNSSNENANFSSADVQFHGLGQGKEHRYIALRFKVNPRTVFLFMKGIDSNGGIEKYAKEYPIETEEN